MRPVFYSNLFGVGAAVMLSAGAVHGADCHFSADCDGKQICVNAACEDPDAEPSTCDGADETSCGWDETCDEGFCKPAGVICGNPAGTCEVTSTSSECQCADGRGMGQSSGSGGASGGAPPEKSGEELYGECVQMLESACGTEAPDIDDFCTAGQRQWCEAAIPKIDQMAEDCGIDLEGDESVSSEPAEGGVAPEPTDADTDGRDRAEEPPQPSPVPEGLPLAELIECCQMLEREGAEELTSCIDDLAEDDCDGLEKCLDVGDSVTGGGREASDDAMAGSDGAGGADDGEKAGEKNEEAALGDDLVEADEEGSCSAVPTRRSGTPLPLLFTLLF